MTFASVVAAAVKAAKAAGGAAKTAAAGSKVGKAAKVATEVGKAAKAGKSITPLLKEYATKTAQEAGLSALMGGSGGGGQAQEGGGGMVQPPDVMGTAPQVQFDPNAGVDTRGGQFPSAGVPPWMAGIEGKQTIPSQVSIPPFDTPQYTPAIPQFDTP